MLIGILVQSYVLNVGIFTQGSSKMESESVRHSVQ